MLKLGLIKEGKVPADSRVALTPAQCKWIRTQVPDLSVKIEASPHRCYSDAEYQRAGMEVTQDLSDCDVLLGIKEVPVAQLIPGKTYLFFSHTKKLQPYNQALLQAMVQKNITLIDYECLEHKDGQRIIGFGFFAGIVGAHNGIMAFGQRTGLFHLNRVGAVKDYRELIHTYFGLKLPPIKIAVTGSGRVAHGILEIMNLMDVQEVEPDEYLSREFDYPVYVHLKGQELYARKDGGKYQRQDFHNNPQAYRCLFREYLSQTDVLMNGIYWNEDIPRLFEMEDLQRPDFRLQTIADITDDLHGSVPCNLGDATITDPVYGVDRKTGQKTPPYQTQTIEGLGHQTLDLMAVGNLPNELPRDASRFFGEQLIKYVLDDIRKGGSPILSAATILDKGNLTPGFAYMADYAAGK